MYFLKGKTNFKTLLALSPSGICWGGIIMKYFQRLGVCSILFINMYFFIEYNDGRYLWSNCNFWNLFLEMHLLPVLTFKIPFYFPVCKQNSWELSIKEFIGFFHKIFFIIIRLLRYLDRHKNNCRIFLHRINAQ